MLENGAVPRKKALGEDHHCQQESVRAQSLQTMKIVDEEMIARYAEIK
tara:strand:+ start:654 stop:797 length:144 start_codon:yes stop_codon:yes gene_type:complete